MLLPIGDQRNFHLASPSVGVLGLPGTMGRLVATIVTVPLPAVAGRRMAGSDVLPGDSGAAVLEEVIQ